MKEQHVSAGLKVGRVTDRMMSLKLEVEGLTMNVISAYFLLVRCEMKEREEFWRAGGEHAQRGKSDYWNGFQWGHW